MSFPGWVDLDGVANMRDVGGLPTQDGGSIQPRRLIRSDNLQDLTSGDIDHLVERLGVTDIVDLRTDIELHIEGPGPLATREALTHHHHSLFRDEQLVDRATTTRDALALPWHAATPTQHRDDQFWARHYLGYLAGRPDSISAALHVVAGSPGATVVHCAAGKDRTGTVVGLALAVAGVPHKEIVADYVLTGERLERVIARLIERPAYADHLQHVPIEDQVPRAETMAHILDALDSEYGGGAGWLRAHGWSEADVDRLRAKLVD